MLIGALLAIVLQRWATIAPSERRRGTGYAALAGVGVLAAVACFAAFALIPDTDGAMYRGGFALFAVAVALLIAAAVSPGPSPVRALLAFGPLVWVGRISYGLYLWHWPVQLALTPERVGVAGVWLDLLRLGATFTIATISFYALELPIRRGVLGRRMRRVLAPAAVVGVATVVVATTAAAVPPPAYLNNAGAQGLDRTLARVSAAKPRAALPVPTTVAPSTAPPTGPPSAGAIAAAAPPTPPVTHPPPRRILGVGDSLLSSLLPGLTPAARARGIVLDSVAIPGCGVFTGEPLAPDDSHLSWAARCGNLMTKLQVSAVQQYRPDVVLWLSSWETADRIVNGQQYTMDSPEGIDMTMQQIDAAVARYTSTGARVVFLTIAPTLPTLEYGSPTAEATKRVLLLNRLLRSYAATHPATTSVVDLAEKICPGREQLPAGRRRHRRAHRRRPPLLRGRRGLDLTLDPRPDRRELTPARRRCHRLVRHQAHGSASSRNQRLSRSRV